MKANNIIIISVNIIILLLVIYPSSPAFNTNDDSILMMVSSGQLYGTPDGALIYVHHWMGSMLAWFYQQIPGLNAYVAFMYGLLFLGIGISGYFVLRAGQQARFTAILLMLAAYVTFLPIVLQPQYTSIAFILGLAALLGLSVPGTSSIVQGLMFSSLFLLASMLRYPAVWGLVLSAAPLLLFRAWYSRQWAILGWLALALSSAYLIRLIDARYYEDKRRHPEVFSYQKNIDILVNGPHTTIKTAHNGEAAALALLESWFWIDSARMGPANLAQMAQGRYQARSLVEGVRYMLAVLNRHKKTLLALLLLFLLAGHFSSPALWLLFCSMAFVFLALSTTARLPDRVFLPMLSAFTFLRLGLIPIRPWASRYTSGGLLFSILLLQGLDLSAAIRENQQIRNDHQAAQAWVNEQPAGKVVVRGGAFPYEGNLSVYGHSQQSIGKLMPVGWLLGTPAYRAYCLKYWQGRDIWQQICTAGLICVDPPIAALSAYVCAHYDISLAFKPIAAPIRKYGKQIPVYWVYAE